MQHNLEQQSNAAYETERKLSAEIEALTQQTEQLHDLKSNNHDLRSTVAERDAVIAEKERVIAAQHRDIVKMRNHSANAVSLSAVSQSMKPKQTSYISISSAYKFTFFKQIFYCNLHCRMCRVRHLTTVLGRTLSSRLMSTIYTRNCGVWHSVCKTRPITRSKTSLMCLQSSQTSVRDSAATQWSV